MIDRSLNYGRHHIRRFLEKSAPFQSIVDLGAGQGDDLLAAKKFSPETKLFAVEAYPPYMEVLRGQGIEVFPLNIEKDKFPFEDESIDVIMGNQILEHCKEVWWILHEVSRVLKPGGKFIIGIPNLASLHNRLLLLLGMQPTCIQNNSAHVRGYTKRDMMKLLNSGFDNGYKLKGFGGSNYYPFPPVIAKPLAKIFPSSAWGIFFLLEKQAQYQGKFLTFPVEEALETNFYLGSQA